MLVFFFDVPSLTTLFGKEMDVSTYNSRRPAFLQGIYPSTWSGTSFRQTLVSISAKFTPTSLPRMEFYRVYFLLCVLPHLLRQNKETKSTPLFSPPRTQRCHPRRRNHQRCSFRRPRRRSCRRRSLLNRSWSCCVYRSTSPCLSIQIASNKNIAHVTRTNKPT